jgi:hypothetical protein
MDAFHSPAHNTRLGFHYFPDTNHYRESDLLAWLPELRSLGTSWLTLIAPIDRAIPELFIHGLLSAGIEPILQFPLNLSEPPYPGDISMLFDAYAKWGVHYAILFDRPNSRSAWSVASWTQEDLVERFLDRYHPIAEVAFKAGLDPVFPPLEPGGNYWDTAFLHTALQSLLRRKKQALLDHLAISAYAWTNERSLNWGAGGPERWPGARPYFTPPMEEDQRGFRIFDWYRAISQSVLQRPCPIIILGVGSPWDHTLKTNPVSNPVVHAQTNFTIARLATGEVVNDPVKPEIILEQMPAEVMACNFWLLAAAPDSPYLQQAWFQPEGQTMPVVGTIRQWFAHSEETRSPVNAAPAAKNSHTIGHYLLLPHYEWGIADWHLEVIRPFVKKYTPTIGFSLSEAAHAGRVTVIGNQNSYSDDDLNMLRNAGCIVERISGDGTSIATQLAER